MADLNSKEDASAVRIRYDKILKEKQEGWEIEMNKLRAELKTWKTNYSKLEVEIISLRK